MSSNKLTDAMNRIVPLAAQLEREQQDMAIWRSYPAAGTECGQGCCGYSGEEISQKIESCSNTIDDLRNGILDILKEL